MRSFLTIAACVALVGQLGVMLGTIAEGRDGQGMRSHVEQAGTSIHYAHSDLCGLCQARSLQTMGAPPPRVAPVSVLSATPSLAADVAPIVSEFFLPSPPRAPPQLS
jgi:hypothetical protein